MLHALPYTVTLALIRYDRIAGCLTRLRSRDILLGMDVPELYHIARLHLEIPQRRRRLRPYGAVQPYSEYEDPVAVFMEYDRIIAPRLPQ
jgi:hypothetical protein